MSAKLGSFGATGVDAAGVVAVAEDSSVAGGAGLIGVGIGAILSCVADTVGVVWMGVEAGVAAVETGAGVEGDTFGTNPDCWFASVACA